MSRSSRLTADITLEAHNMLRDLCDKHERSKGFLLEKMIRKFCGGETEKTTSTQVAIVEKPKVKRFVPPLLNDVYEYMIEKGVNDFNEANKFNDFYESNGWKVGKNKMKCWKAAVRNWLKNYKVNSNGKDILAISAASEWHKEEDQGF